MGLHHGPVPLSHAPHKSSVLPSGKQLNPPFWFASHASPAVPSHPSFVTGLHSIAPPIVTQEPGTFVVSGASQNGSRVVVAPKHSVWHSVCAHSNTACTAASFASSQAVVSPVTQSVHPVVLSHAATSSQQLASRHVPQSSEKTPAQSPPPPVPPVAPPVPPVPPPVPPVAPPVPPVAPPVPPVPPVAPPVPPVAPPVPAVPPVPASAPPEPPESEGELSSLPHAATLRTAFPLHVARPVIFGGFFIPKPAIAMTWSEAAEGALVVQPSSTGIASDQDKLRQRLSCADVSLDVPSFDPLSALKVKTDTLRRVSLGKAKELALAIEPGGTAEARVSLDEGFASEARVLEEKGDHTRILLESSSGFAFGWVASALLVAIADDAPDFGWGGLGLGGFGHGGGGRGLLRPVEYICPHEVRLLIDQTATEGAIRQVHRYVVGGYRANTKIVANEPKGERTAVLLPGKAAKIFFHLEQSELIFSSELQKCREVAPKPRSSAGAR